MQTFATPAPITAILAIPAGRVQITVSAAAGVCATLDAGTTMGRIRNSLKNAGGSPALDIQATATVGDITATSR
jgi:ribose/xylose/arabinose/galactoside ABC-type transport system permease subunit